MTESANVIHIVYLSSIFFTFLKIYFEDKAMEFKDRLLEVITDRFTNQKKFAAVLGMTRQSLHSVIKNGSPSVQFLSSLREHVPDININWLLFGDGPKYLSDFSEYNMVNDPASEYGDKPDSMLLFLQRMVERLQDQVDELQSSLIEKSRQKQEK